MNRGTSIDGKWETTGGAALAGDDSLTTALRETHKADFLKINKPYVDYHTYLDLLDFGIYTLMYATLDGKLILPDNPETGALLTLVIVK
jgi:hypothetical protein